MFLRDDNFYCHFLNTETSSAQATIFGRPIMILFWLQDLGQVLLGVHLDH